MIKNLQVEDPKDPAFEQEMEDLRDRLKKLDAGERSAAQAGDAQQ
jgi:hypothetical protein